METSFAAFYMGYAFVFTWGYDTLFPPSKTEAKSGVSITMPMNSKPRAWRIRSAVLRMMAPIVVRAVPRVDHLAGRGRPRLSSQAAFMPQNVPLPQQAVVA